jgi:NitT/TauT family transport system permease protein
MTIGSTTEVGSRRTRSAIPASVTLPIVGALVTLAVWRLSIAIFDIPPYLIPTPGAVLKAFAADPAYILTNAWVTLQETIKGFAIAVVAGVVTGAALASSSFVERAMYPQLIALNAVPKVALAPMLAVWVGLGQGAKVLMAVTMCFFPIVLATVTGVTTTAADLVEMSRSLSANRWQTFIKVRLPAAMPHIFIGLKTAMPLAVIGAVIGEFFSGSEGLGFVIQNATSDMAIAFAAIAVLAATSIVLYYAVVAVERLLLPWVRETTA